MHHRSPQQPVFIFGFPRSGTTLLQRFLNSYPDTLIWGEHVAFLKSIANAYFQAWRNPDFFKSPTPLDEILQDTKPLTHWQGWLNWVGEDEWRRLYRQFFESIFVPGGLPGKRFWGWKEVHYTGSEQEQTLPFLAAIYPEAKYVFLVRNGFNTMASFTRWTRRRNIADWQQEGCAQWNNMIRSFRDWHRSGKVESFWIQHEELIEGKGEVLRLLESMGKSIGDDQWAVLKAESGRGSSFGTHAYNERWRELSALRLGVALACLGKLNRELGYETPPVPLHGRVGGETISTLISCAHCALQRVRRLGAARSAIS
jgi:hypothetical protein